MNSQSTLVTSATFASRASAPCRGASASSSQFGTGQMFPRAASWPGASSPCQVPSIVHGQLIDPTPLRCRFELCREGTSLSAQRLLVVR
jgi:hypothetical protein